MSINPVVPDEWEKLRHMTLDQVITAVKLSAGGNFFIQGHTTPEGFPFMVALIIGRPSNVDALSLGIRFRQTFEQLARRIYKTERERWP